MDLIRAIVLAVRDHEGKPTASEVQAIITEDENGVYAYHIALLTQSELMVGVDTSPRKDRYGVANLFLTWEGQDFADNIASDAVWASSQKKLENAGLKSASFEVWTKVAVDKINELLADS